MTDQRTLTDAEERVRRRKPQDLDYDGNGGDSDRPGPPPFWPRNREWWVGLILQLVPYGVIGWLVLHFAGGKG